MCGELIADATRDGARVIVVLSEYGITPVATPVHINRALRQAGLLQVRDEHGRELLDPGAVRRLRRRRSSDRARLRARPGRVAEVRGAARGAARRRARARRRAASAPPASTTRARASWSRSPRPTPGSPTTTGSTTRARRTSRAPSRSIASPATTRSSCSSIRRSASRSSRSAWRLAKRASASARLMDVIPLDATLVKGSHGRLPDDAADGAAADRRRSGGLAGRRAAGCHDGVKQIVLRHLFEGGHA